MSLPRACERWTLDDHRQLAYIRADIFFSVRSHLSLSRLGSLNSVVCHCRIFRMRRTGLSWADVGTVPSHEGDVGSTSTSSDLRGQLRRSGREKSAFGLASSIRLREGACRLFL